MVSTSGSSGTAPDPPLGAGRPGPLDHGVGPGRPPGASRASAISPSGPSFPTSTAQATRAAACSASFLDRPSPHPALRPGHQHPGPVPAGVVGAGALDLVAGQLTDPAQHDLLQAGLEVLGPGPGRRQLDPVVEQAQDHPRGHVPPPVEIDGADDGFRRRWRGSTPCSGPPTRPRPGRAGAPRRGRAPAPPRPARWCSRRRPAPWPGHLRACRG